MPQKPVIKGKKIQKVKAANRHGKLPQTKIGHYERKPQKAKLIEAYKDSKEITKMINAKNESLVATQAENAGGRLKALKGPPPVLAPKDAKQAAKRGAASKKEESEEMSEDDE